MTNPSELDGPSLDSGGGALGSTTKRDRADSMKGQAVRAVMQFIFLGVFLGLMLGVWEAAVLYFVPSTRQFQVVDATWVIWFIAPSLDMIAFGLLGATLGFVGASGEGRSPRFKVVLLAVLLSATGGHVGWARHFLHTHQINMHVFDSGKALLFPLLRALATFVLALSLLRLFRSRAEALFDPAARWPFRTMGKVLLHLVTLLTCGLILYKGRAWSNGGGPSAGQSAPDTPPPNIVLITLDTVRADHLSAYGYSRPTTPNIDALGRRGVLFENAIASAPWTLASLASIFTGLLPHQQGANAFRPVDLGVTTLAEALSAHGYESVGFNANYYYGQAGWGIGQGFQVYDDDRTTIEYNASRTVVGRTLFQPTYQDLEKYDAFYRRNARDLNTDVLRWFRKRSARPFFLYINYFDAHLPYLPPAPYNRRFGEVPPQVARRSFDQQALQGGTLGGRQRDLLIAGYDNCLAYLDAQLGDLLGGLQKSPAWRNTVLVIASDHGEEFGEHGHYGHGFDLNREEIQVPLLILGPGIPAGQRINTPVSVRSLFATVLDLGLGNLFPVHRFSLARFWETGFGGRVPDETIISEVGTGLAKVQPVTISLFTDEWHYIQVQGGGEELFNRITDPQEHTDLAKTTAVREVLAAMRQRLEEEVSGSLQPWLGREYLLALDRPGYTVPALGSAGILHGLRRILGAEQAFVNPEWLKFEPSPLPFEKQMLQSLPYQ